MTTSDILEQVSELSLLGLDAIKTEIELIIEQKREAIKESLRESGIKEGDIFIDKRPCELNIHKVIGPGYYLKEATVTTIQLDITNKEVCVYSEASYRVDELEAYYPAEGFAFDAMLREVKPICKAHETAFNNIISKAHEALFNNVISNNDKKTEAK